jgi:hypothetical protein
LIDKTENSYDTAKKEFIYSANTTPCGTGIIPFTNRKFTQSFELTAGGISSRSYETQPPRSGKEEPPHDLPRQYSDLTLTSTHSKETYSDN